MRMWAIQREDMRVTGKTEGRKYMQVNSRENWLEGERWKDQGKGRLLENHLDLRSVVVTPELLPNPNQVGGAERESWARFRLEENTHTPVQTGRI